MFDIKEAGGGRIELHGRLDASQTDRAREILNAVNESCIIDFGALDYISSAGLGVLLGAQKRLAESGKALKLVNLNRHIRELFHIAGFDHIFEIE